LKMLSKLRIFSYLLWIAFTLICINIVWKYLGSSLSKQVHTFGLVIQLIGIISVVFLLMGKEKLARYANALENTIEQGIDTLLLQPLVSSDEHLKSYSIIVFIKLLLFSACNVAIYLSSIYLEIDSFLLFVLLFGMLILYLYIWAWSFLLIIIFRLFYRREPGILGRIYEMSDYGLSMIAVIIFLIVFIPIRDFISWLSRTTIVDQITILTLPLIFIGTVFQLLATFLF